MKILIINNNYQPTGGAETYVRLLDGIFKQNNNEVYHFAIDDNVEIFQPYLFVYRNGSKNRILKHFLAYYFDPVLYIRLRKWIKKINPDVIHIQNIGIFTLPILLAVRDCPTIVKTVHDISILCPSRAGYWGDGIECECGLGMKCGTRGCVSWFRLMYKTIPFYLNLLISQRIIHSYIVASTSLANKLRRFGYSPVFTVMHFVDLSIQPLVYPADDTPTILFVGRVEKEKGVCVLLKSFQKVIHRFPRCILIIAGYGSYLETIQGTPASEPCSSLWILGKIPPDEVQLWYQKAWVVAVPSIIFENTTMVICEAMAAGRPVVGSRIGGIEHITDQITGLLCEPGNSDDLAEKICLILGNSNFGALLGKNAREYAVRNFSSQNHYSRLMDIYLRRNGDPSENSPGENQNG